MPGAFRYETLSQAASPEEGRFYLLVANFFLQEKQKELIKQGVY